MLLRAVDKAADRCVRSPQDFENLIPAQQEPLQVALQRGGYRRKRAGLMTDASDNHTFHDYLVFYRHHRPSNPIYQFSIFNLHVFSQFLFPKRSIRVRIELSLNPNPEPQPVPRSPPEA